MDGFLEHFGSELGSHILVHFPKLGILNSFKFACIAKVAFDAAAGLFLEAICVNLGIQSWCNSYFGPTNFMTILFSESRSPLRLWTRFWSCFTLAARSYFQTLKRHAHTFLIQLPLCPSSGLFVCLLFVCLFVCLFTICQPSVLVVQFKVKWMWLRMSPCCTNWHA